MVCVMSLLVGRRCRRSPDSSWRGADAISGPSPTGVDRSRRSRRQLGRRQPALPLERRPIRRVAMTASQVGRSCARRGLNNNIRLWVAFVSGEPVAANVLDDRSKRGRDAGSHGPRPHRIERGNAVPRLVGHSGGARFGL